MIQKSEVDILEQRLPGLRMLVIGDLMLDQYLWGRVERISPEAPVPVIDVAKSEGRPGGAANVALNAAAMGAKVLLSGVVGDDGEGERLLSLLGEQGFDTETVLVVPGRPTTTKTRVIGNRQQMLRVDREDRSALEADLRAELVAKVKARSGDFDVLVFEDYDKGVLGPVMIGELVDWAAEEGIPTVVDPKFQNFFAYRNCTLFKPNLKELNEGMKVQLAKEDFDGFRNVLAEFRKEMPHENTLVTLSEHGVLAVDHALGLHHIPAHYRKITDVSGAGDTVVALMGLGLAAGLSLAGAAYIANLGGGLVCEEVGVVPVDRQRLFRELHQLAIASE